MSLNPLSFQQKETPIFYVKRNLGQYAALISSMAALIPSLNLGIRHTGRIGEFIFFSLAGLIILAEVVGVALIMRHRKDVFPVSLQPEGIQILDRLLPLGQIQEVKIIQSVLQIRLREPRKFVTYVFDRKQKQEIVELLRAYTKEHGIMFVEK